MQLSKSWVTLMVTHEEDGDDPPRLYVMNQYDEASGLDWDEIWSEAHTTIKNKAIGWLMDTSTHINPINWGTVKYIGVLGCKTSPVAPREERPSTLLGTMPDDLPKASKPSKLKVRKKRKNPTEEAVTPFGVKHPLLERADELLPGSIMMYKLPEQPTAQAYRVCFIIGTWLYYLDPENNPASQSLLTIPKDGLVGVILPPAQPKPEPI
jgi:hypothetical protein